MILANVPPIAREASKKSIRKSIFLLFLLSHKKSFDKYSLPTEAALELVYAQNKFAVECDLHPFLVNWQKWCNLRAGYSALASATPF